MRRLADADRIRALMRGLCRAATEPGQVFIAGGATAVLLGWRETTVDVDLKLVPDSDTVLRAIPALKESLEVNVELATPDDFIPVPPQWNERSPFIVQEGPLTFRHFDLASQALAKIERGHAQDMKDVAEMLARGLVSPARLRADFEVITPLLYRYPALDAAAFRRALDAALGTQP
jgi:uncharacterized nucleotidyltransferase DUF6036